MSITLKDPKKAKHLDKGLVQLSKKELLNYLFDKVKKMLGAVGMLQFDVVKFRLQDDNVEVTMLLLVLRVSDGLSFLIKNLRKICQDYSHYILRTVKIDYALVFDLVGLKLKEKNPEVKFYMNSDYIES